MMEWQANEWTPMGGANEFLQGDGFLISYNPQPGGVIAMFASDTGEGETALVIEAEQDEYKILNGDFRKEYEEAFPRGLDACLAVYESLKDEHGSSWSDK